MKPFLRYCDICLLAAGAAVSLWYCSAASENKVNPFYVWVTVPFAIEFLWSSYLGRRHDNRFLPFCSCAVAGLMLAFTRYAYDTSVHSKSSTAALVFIFVPLYLLIGAPILLGLCHSASRFIPGYRGRKPK